MDRVRENGVALDAAFRHFDSDGDGLISIDELEQGLLDLGIFSDIKDRKAQTAAMISKFDKNDDGNLSLKEFFRFLGLEDYTPTVIQRMTKIFSLAHENG